MKKIDLSMLEKGRRYSAEEIIQTIKDQFKEQGLNLAASITQKGALKKGDWIEHTINNNRNKEENMTAAESRIRDADISTEMVDFSNLSIIQQAGQAVLAQANQSRNLLLSLLG